MRYTLKAFQDEQDYWRLRAFLREVFLLNGRRERGWQPYRFDYWRWHIVANCHESTIHNRVYWWENAQGEIVAAIHSEGQRDAWLEVHPSVRDIAFEEEMIRTAMEKLAQEQDNGGHTLVMWVDRQEALRCETLSRLGFSPTGRLERQRYADLTAEIAPVPAPAGYTIRSLGDVDELPSRSWASWTAFHPNEPDSVYGGWEWYRGVQRAPLYRRDLDIVAATPDGEIVSFCTGWFDDATRTCGVEPVGTDKYHHRRGLATAVVTEALRRAQRLGATLATIGSWNDVTDHLYGKLGFAVGEEMELWEKKW